MIMVLKRDLDIIKVYVYTENEVPSFSEQTGRYDWNFYLPTYTNGKYLWKYQFKHDRLTTIQEQIRFYAVFV